jgi:ectoine hydroxylase-related dioxygenase (phytanoyl-CoA dioxygenase family)
MGTTRFTADAAPEQLADSLREHGYAIVEELAGDPLLERFETEIAPHLDLTPAGEDDFTGHNTRRPGCLIARSPAARDLVMQPLVLDTIREAFAPRKRVQLHLTQVIAIGPGEPAQMVHRDQWAFDFFPFPAGYEAQVNTMWALTEFTDANGATRIIPGSNHWEDGLRPSFEDTVPAEMPRGSVLLYTGSLYHGGGGNRTEATRIGINIDYCRPWLRQEENQYLACPPEVARTLDEDLLKLMGYSRGAYALGYVDNGRDPLDVLLGRNGSTFAPSA